MGAMKRILEDVATKMGIPDPNDEAVIREVDRQLAQLIPECGVDCHCDSEADCEGSRPND